MAEINVLFGFCGIHRRQIVPHFDRIMWCYNHTSMAASLYELWQRVLRCFLLTLKAQNVVKYTGMLYKI